MGRTPMDEEVIWKDVVGFEGRYKVSTSGEIMSYDRKVPSRNPEKFSTRKGRFLRQMTMRHGYKKVSLTRNVIDKKNILVHRVVAEAFLPNKYNLPMVNHIDGNKGNNNVKNLEWVDAFGNMQHYEKYLKPKYIREGIYGTISC